MNITNPNFARKTTTSVACVMVLESFSVATDALDLSTLRV